MAHNLTTVGELNKMTVQDLSKEARTQRDAVVKLRMGVKLGKEKNSADYQREKKQLARILTVLTQKLSSEKKTVSQKAS